MYFREGIPKCRLNSGPRKDSCPRTKKGDNLLDPAPFPDARRYAQNESFSPRQKQSAALLPPVVIQSPV